ncbi:MAG: hypothetical protein H7X97_00235 [Opitutaceae bacterium]|nr:hypothetical protein [Verrucomicrobiales bacterium]
MSARQIGSLTTKSQLPGFQTHLSLRSAAVRIHESGMEFQSTQPLAPWTEMTVELETGQSSSKVSCTGVVVSCQATLEGGYTVTMVFSGLSRQSKTRLNNLAHSRLA